MNKQTLFLIVSLYIACFSTFAQDPVFTQSLFVMESVNPSFSGFEDEGRIHSGIMHRTQWPNLDLKIDTEFAFINKSVDFGPRFGFGYGVSILRHQEAFTQHNFYQINFNYSQRINLNGGWYFRPALEAGIGHKDFNFNTLVLADQINIYDETSGGSSNDPLSVSEASIFFVDFSTGVLFEREDYAGNTYWFGASVKHLNRPNISLVEGENSPLDILFSVHGNYRFPFLTNYTMIMAANYLQQGGYNRLDLGAFITFNNFILGSTFVTNPNKNNTNLLNSVNAFVGLDYEKFRFGLSYDFNLSKLGKTDGVYEISVTYLSGCRTCSYDRERKKW